MFIQTDYDKTYDCSSHLYIIKLSADLYQKVMFYSFYTIAEHKVLHMINSNKSTN